jgi:predicted  nucleic acid-binding Zn-ribbon protein
MAWIVAYEDAAMVAPLDELRERKEQIQERTRSLLDSQTIYDDLGSLGRECARREQRIEGLDQGIADRHHRSEQLDGVLSRQRAQLAQLESRIVEIERETGLSRDEILGKLREFSILQKEIQSAEQYRNELYRDGVAQAELQGKWADEKARLKEECARLETHEDEILRGDATHLTHEQLRRMSLMKLEDEVRARFNSPRPPPFGTRAASAPHVGASGRTIP